MVRNNLNGVQAAKVRIINNFKRLLKYFFRLLSLEVSWRTPGSDPSLQILSAIRLKKCNVVFDIGANAGQFALDLRSCGYDGKIISFEPLSSARKMLLKKSARDNNWEMHRQTAVGDFNGEIEINIAGNSVSSSVLSMLNSHSSVAPESIYVGKEIVPMCSLDSVADIYLKPEDNLFIKIDTQGFEWQVLEGARDTLKKAEGVLCELSLIPLYKNQHLWREIVDRLEADGFSLWAIQKGFTDSVTGRSLQVDAIFLRN